MADDRPEPKEDPRAAVVRGLLPPRAGSGVFVTVRDSVTGEEQTMEIPEDDYVLIPVGNCYRAHGDVDRPASRRAGAPDRRPALTARQRAALEAICAHIAAAGYPPTVRELGDAVGLSSTQSVVNVLHRLQAKGYLQRDPGIPRGIRVLP